MRARPIILAALTFAAISAGGCTRAGGDAIAVTGSVADDVVVLSMPGLGAEPTSTPDPGWSRIASAPVALGSQVERGAVVALLDDGVGRAGVDLAEGQLAEARAQEAVLGEKIDEVASKRSDVASTRADLRDRLAKLRDQRDRVAGQLAQARKLAARIPPSGAQPPPSGTPGAAPTQDPRAMVAQLSAALAKVDAGIAQAEDALAKLDEASATLADARSALDAAKEAASALVSARQAGVRLAQARLSLATVRAPVDGVVVTAPVLGSVLAAGAPLAQIRPATRASEVVTYLTADQAELIAPGDRAAVRVDSLPGRTFDARVERVGSEYVYVPGRFATREIHLLRGFEVRLELTGEVTLPAGTPADLIIHPR